jgi:hypothetical protein
MVAQPHADNQTRVAELHLVPGQVVSTAYRGNGKSLIRKALLPPRFFEQDPCNSRPAVCGMGDATFFLRQPGYRVIHEDQDNKQTTNYVNTSRLVRALAQTPPAPTSTWGSRASRRYRSLACGPRRHGEPRIVRRADVQRSQTCCVIQCDHDHPSTRRCLRMSRWLSSSTRRGS